MLREKINDGMKDAMIDRVYGLAILAALVIPLSGVSANETKASEKQIMAQHRYVGMWVTDDGHIRHELLPSGRYDEARGSRQSAYQGRYEIRGNHIDYWDDTGFTAGGEFVDHNTLHHGGMIFRRR